MSSFCILCVKTQLFQPYVRADLQIHPDVGGGKMKCLFTKSTFWCHRPARAARAQPGAERSGTPGMYDKLEAIHRPARAKALLFNISRCVSYGYITIRAFALSGRMTYLSVPGCRSALPRAVRSPPFQGISVVAVRYKKSGNVIRLCSLSLIHMSYILVKSAKLEHCNGIV